MKTNHNKATPRVYHTLRQIVQRIPRWLIEKTANAHGVDAKFPIDLANACALGKRLVANAKAHFH